METGHTRRRGRRIWFLGVLTAFGVLALFGWHAPTRRSPLPVATGHPELPPLFAKAEADALHLAQTRGEAEDIRSLACLYQANRLFAQARQCYGVLASVAPGLAAEDHYRLAAMLMDESDMEGARDELNLTLAKAPDYVPARVALAEVLFKTGDAQNASVEFARVLTQDSDNLEAALGLARAALQKGAEDEAISRLRQVLRAHPESSLGSALLAQLLERRGVAQEAAGLRARSQETHDRVPADPWLDRLLKSCYINQTLSLAFERYRLAGQMDEAVGLLDRLEQLDPSSPITPMMRGWSLEKAGRLGEAETQYRLSLSRGYDPEKICPMLSDVLIRQGRLSDDLSLLGDYHARLPKSVPILKSYCEAAVRSKDLKLSRQLLSEALALDPYLYLANLSMAQVLWDSGERDRAAVYLKRVASVYPIDIESRVALGIYFIDKPDPGAAVSVLEEARSLMKPEGDARAGRVAALLFKAYVMNGSLEASLGHFEKSAAQAEKAIALEPKDELAHTLKVNALRQEGNFKGAAEAMEPLVRLKPRDPAFRLIYGDLRYQAGDVEGAREQWREVLRDAPSDAADLRNAASDRLGGRINATTFTD